MPPENNETPVVETPAVETPVVDTPAVETPPADGPKSVAEAISAGIDSAPARGPKPADEPAEEPKGEEKPAAGEGDKKPDGKDAAASAEEKPKEEKPKADADHINDPIPKELSERAQERIRSLVGFVKERDEALTVQGNLIKSIQDTGVTAEGFADTIGFLRLANSDKPADLEQALALVQQQAYNLALRLGKEVPGVDLLDKHPDLSQAVKYGQINREHALELARGRTLTKQQKEAAEKAQSEAAVKTQLENAKTAAITELNAYGEQLRANDPDYQRKYDLLVGPMKAAFETVHPSNWPAVFKRAYEGMKLPPAAPAAAPAAPPPGMIRDPATGQFVAKKVPIRPQNPAGGSTKAPGSIRDAIDSALAGLQR